MDREDLPLALTIIQIIAGILLLPYLLGGLLFFLGSIADDLSAEDYVVLDSSSPGGSCHILVEGKAPNDFLRKGPTDVTIRGEMDPSSFRAERRKLYIEIRNRGHGVYEGQTAWLFWETDSEAVIVFLGELQIPTVIRVTFGDRIEFTEQQSSELAREILERYQIDSEEISGYFR